MTIRVKKDWWKTLFDEIYLKTDARSICDDTLTCREVDFVIRRLNLDQWDRVLDLCGGQGRHALELSRRGFSRVFLLDYSACLLNRGLQAARQSGLDIAFIRGDARWLGVRDQTFKAVLIMGSSFGYFGDEAENRRILENAGRALKPSGRLLLDLPCREYVIKNFRPESRHTTDDGLEIIRTRELKSDTIYAREKVVSPTRGVLRVNTYCTRLYDTNQITTLLADCGFSDFQTESGFMDRSRQGDYGSMTSRMIVLATKI